MKGDPLLADSEFDFNVPGTHNQGAESISHRLAIEPNEVSLPERIVPAVLMNTIQKRG